MHRDLVNITYSQSIDQIRRSKQVVIESQGVHNPIDHSKSIAKKVFIRASVICLTVLGIGCDPHDFQSNTGHSSEQEVTQINSEIDQANLHDSPPLQYDAIEPSVGGKIKLEYKPNKAERISEAVFEHKDLAPKGVLQTQPKAINLNK